MRGPKELPFQPEAVFELCTSSRTWLEQRRLRGQPSQSTALLLAASNAQALWRQACSYLGRVSLCHYYYIFITPSQGGAAEPLPSGDEEVQPQAGTLDERRQQTLSDCLCRVYVVEACSPITSPVAC